MTNNALLNLLITLVVVGVILWGVEQIPMDAVIKKVVRVVIIVVVCIWVLRLLIGFFPVTT